MIGRVTEALSKVKGSIGSNERHALPGVIGDDLLRFGKLPLCLFICIIITAITVVTTAHHTRLLTVQREQLVLERDALDIEWRNLILEENALGDHSRVERIATEKNRPTLSVGVLRCCAAVFCWRWASCWAAWPGYR
ncbi:MAG: cell division protein FtsL [Klebsiella grimontii]|nr:cell division protein FtsL [Klebsiella grimontii]